MNTIIRPADRQQWLKYREKGIGSSEVGTILGLNPFETPYTLWLRKKGKIAPKQENFAMKAGHYLEDAVSRFYSDATGRQIIKRSAGDWLIVDKQRDYLRVSPDRIFWVDPTGKKNHDNKGICECKTTQLQVDADDLPKHWFCQLQYQLGVAELHVGALAWLTMGREFGYKDIEFDQEFYDWMVSQIEEFWQRYIVGNEEPAAINAEDVMIKSPRHVPGKTVTADQALLDELAELKQLKASTNGEYKRVKDMENDLKVAIGDAEALVDTNGRTLCTWKAAKDSMKFDEKGFAAACPDLYKEWQKPVPGSRRFLVK